VAPSSRPSSRQDVEVPLPNRVTPEGELVAVPERGLFYGNRGCLHDDSGRIVRFAANRRWIVCVLEFGQRRRHPLMQPGRFTELFFLDEATAFAAGHRPCAECRRERYEAFRAAWAASDGSSALPTAGAIDDRLDAERRRGSARRFELAESGSLPVGAMFRHEGDAHLVVAEGWSRPWTPAGYGERRARSAGPVVLLTPPSTVEVIRRGYEPVLHPSADG
jgi:hypothetical protein